MPPIQRRFVDTAEGQVHYREAGSGGTPLVMLHPSPGSAKMLEPLQAALAAKRRVLALDTLGNGDSAAPRRPDPDLAYFVDGHRKALDAIGLERFDLYGSHTGANLAIELAIGHPVRVRRLILDGVSLYAPEERAEMLARYVRPVQPDAHGSQIHFLWNFVRDVYLFWPWYKPDAAHARGVGLPSAEELHDKAVEVFKAARTYHLSYRAAIAYEKEARLPLVEVPTLLACARSDMLLQYFERVKGLLPAAQAVITEGPADAAARFDAFLA